MRRIPNKTITRSFCFCCGQTLHSGADNCPNCGYALPKADRIFGTEDVEFKRVSDVAGVLTQRELAALVRGLEKIERKLPPIVLGVYITNHGKISEFTQEAHWVLNHSRMRRNFYGKRKVHKANETNAENNLRELSPEERRTRAEQQQNPLKTAYHWVRGKFQRELTEMKQEWMLMLVLDVQLEIACFSWGYKLDPYVNPDLINSSIIQSRLLFRERAMVPALKKVMTLAVRSIAVGSRGINKSIPPAGSTLLPRLSKACALTLGGFSLLSLPVAEAQSPFVDGEDAEPVEEAPPAAPLPTPAPQPTAPVVNYTRGSAASYRSAPTWRSDDFDNLMQSRINGCFNMLMPGQTGVEPTPLPKTPKDSGPFGESDKEVLGHYTEEYMPRTGRALPNLNDPQKILTDVERGDAAYVLEGLNAHSPFRICVSIFKAGQHVPPDLSAPALVRSIARIDEYMVLLQYGMGDTPTVDLGLKSIDMKDEDRLAFLAELEAKVAEAGGGVEGLMEAMRCVKARFEGKASTFVPLTAGSGFVLKPVLPGTMLEEEAEEKELSLVQKVIKYLNEHNLLPYAITGGAGLLSVAGLSLIYVIRRRSGKLLETEPDYRMMSPFGAGVSRYVEYLLGNEAPKAEKVK